MQIIGSDYEDIIETYTEKINTALFKAIKGEDINFLHHPDMHIETEIVRNIYNAACSKAKNLMVEYYFNEIVTLMRKRDFDIAHKLALKVKDFSHTYREIVREKINKFLVEDMFPLGSIEYLQFRVYSISIKLLKEFDDEALNSYVEELKNKFKNDRMFNYRIFGGSLSLYK